VTRHPATGARYEALARTIRRRVLRWTGLPVPIAFAPTTTLAKVGTARARQLERAGLPPTACLAASGPELRAILEVIPIRDL
jgi:DNA polymerase V